MEYYKRILFSIFTGAAFILLGIGIANHAHATTQEFPEGTLISSFSYDGDPDIFIINKHGYKRLFLNPVIFSFYGHLKNATVRQVPASTKDQYENANFYRNCQANDPSIYALQTDAEDTGTLRHIDTSAQEVLKQDSAFFQKVFCIDSEEFFWYNKATAYTSLASVVPYKRVIGNLPPVIYGVSGPTTLVVNQQGTWTVKASDPKNGLLTYTVNWGDNEPIGSGVSGASQLIPVSQTATFTHSYVKAGIYTSVFTVTDNQGLSAKTSISVNVGGSVTASIIVLSPNGGETWTKGTTQTIKWQDNTPFPSSPPCQVGTICPQIFVARLYDITLAPYYPPCTSDVCPEYAIRAPYTIAKGVYDSSYSWLVGKVLDTYEVGGTAPNGAYTIQICQTNSTTCDSSDSYFKIVSGSTQPSITILSPNGGEIWEKGETYNIKWCGDGIFPQGWSTVFLSKRDGTILMSLTQPIGVTPCSSGNSNFTWLVPIDLPLGSDYEVQIVYKSQATGESIAKDVSNAVFSIVRAGTVSITSFKANPETAPSDGVVNLVWSGISVSKYTLFMRCPNGVSVVYGQRELCNAEGDMAQKTSISGKFTNSTQQNQQVEIELRAYGATGIFDHAWSLTVIVPPPVTTLLSPNGGEFLERGATYTISFSTKNAPAGAVIGRILLYKGDAFIMDILPFQPTLPPSGSFLWTVPGGSVIGGGFKIAINLLGSDGSKLSSDFSDSGFNIVPPGTIDLELRSVSKSSLPYTFNLTVCMNGTKSIAMLKEEEYPRVKGFPWRYVIPGDYDYIFYGDAGGYVEEISNGQCTTIGIPIQPNHQAAYDRYKVVEVSLDPNGVIPEFNENNNHITFNFAL